MAFLLKIGKAFLGFCSSINALASFGIFLVMVFVCTDVVGRVFFNSPIMGTSEVVKVGVVGLVFMQVPWAFWENRHIRSDLIAGRLGPRGQIFAALVRNVIAFSAMLFIFLANWKPMMKAWKILEYEGEGALHVPVYPLFTIIQLGSGLAAIIAVYSIIRNIQSLVKPQPEN
jgi:TRAP-type C4-dicarboxylate transport system permease small subunit